jgi:hypothetical protein
MYSAAGLAISCPEHARLESEFIEARDRMRGLMRLRKLEAAEERVKKAWRKDNYSVTIRLPLCFLGHSLRQGRARRAVPLRNFLIFSTEV